MKANKLLLLLLLLILGTLQSESCDALMKAWLSAPETLPPIVYADSGKFLNDLGDYNNCLYNSDLYVYFTLSVVNRLARAVQNIGICAPIECKEELAANIYASLIQDNLN